MGKRNDSAPVSIGELPSVDGIAISATAASMLAANEVGDRSAYAAKVVEQLAFEGLSAEQAAAAFLAATGDWFGRYEKRDPHVDFLRLWGKFGTRHAEERAVAANIADRLMAPKSIAAANDNAPVLPPFSITDWPASRFIGDPPKTKELVDGVIPLGVPAMVAAMGDTGKSYALLELHRRVSFGSSVLERPIFGGRVKTEGASVMITSEDDAAELHRRLAALDAGDQRFGKHGGRMITVPLPSAGGPQVFWRDDKRLGLVETDAWKRLGDQLLRLPDLRVVTLDPLASFAHVNINEDPSAGAFVCASLGRLATETGATIFVAHHMRKTQKAIENLSDAREAIRGSTALVDGLRLAYALWPAEEKRARAACKAVGVEYSANRVVLGGVVKANGAARRIVSTYVRNEFGLLVDRTADLGASAPPQEDVINAMIRAIADAAKSGQPFTKTGATGLFANKERLPMLLRTIPRHKMENLVGRLLEDGGVVTCLANGTTAKWLDIPTGNFAIGLGEFRKGMTRN